MLVKRIQATLDLARHTIRTDNRNLAALLMIVTELVRLRQALRQAWKDDDPSLRTGKHLIKAWFKPFENRVDRAITYILEMLIHQGVSVAGATNRGADCALDQILELPHARKDIASRV